MTRTLFPVLLALAACASAPVPASSAGAAGPGPTAAPAAGALPPLLVQLRALTGGAAWDRVGVIATDAKIEVGGLTGTLESIEDTATGRHRDKLAVAFASQSSGFDGHDGWEQSIGGEVVVPDAPEAIAQAKTGAWTTRHGYFQPGGARYRDLGDKRVDGKRLRGLEATPDGGSPIELWFDDAGLLARTVERDGGDLTTTDLGDYRDVGGVKLPWRAVVDHGDPRSLLTITTTQVRFESQLPASAWARPGLDVDRLTFADGGTSTEVALDLINNHIFIHALVDGQPVRMIVDTGGLNMLTPAAAKRLGLHGEGKLAAAGVGAEKADLAIAAAKTLTVGSAVLADPLFYVIDTDALADLEGESFDGLVGFELFERLVVRLDYPAHRMTLTRPAAFVPPAGAIVVPFDMKDRMPIVPGSIDGIPGRFWVDTGSRASLTTSAAFTKAHHLEAKYHPAFETQTGAGVGGPVFGKPVRFHEVKIGDAVVHEVVGDLFTGTAGAFSDPDAAANLGGGILHRFAVTFAYASKRMYLEPGPDHDAREIYDRSGLLFHRDGEVLKVVAVTPHGPGQAAGMAVGDRVVRIDGKPPTDKPLWAWRQFLRESKPGTRVVLSVERAGAPRSVTITLAEQVP